MSAVPDVGLRTPQVRTDEVTLIGELFDTGSFGAPIVAGENEQRVLCQAMFFQRGGDFTDNIVCLHDKVAVLAQSTSAFPLWCRNDRRVG